MHSLRNFVIRWRRTSVCSTRTAAHWLAIYCCRVTCTSHPTTSPSTVTCLVTWLSCWYRRSRCWRSAKRRPRASYRTRLRWRPRKSDTFSARYCPGTRPSSWWSRFGTPRWSRGRRTCCRRSPMITSSWRRTSCWSTTLRGWTPRRTSRACPRAAPISPRGRRPSAPTPTARQWLSAGRVCRPPGRSRSAYVYIGKETFINHNEINVNQSKS